MGLAVDCDNIEGYPESIGDIRELFVHKSLPFRDLLPTMLKPSQNMYAETFTRTLGWRESGTGSFQNGKKVVEDVDFFDARTYYRISGKNNRSPGKIQSE